MVRSAILIAVCGGLIWMSRGVGGALLEIDDYRPSVGLGAVPQSARAAHGAQAKFPTRGVRLMAGRAKPLSAESMTVVATNEPVEYPGLYASLLRADAADMFADVSFGESTWQSATSSAIHLQAPATKSPDVGPTALKAVRPMQLITLSGETFEEPSCNGFNTCDGLSFTCDGGLTCEGTCDTTCASTCDGETCDGGFTCDSTCFGMQTCDNGVTCVSTCLGMPTCDVSGSTCEHTCYGSGPTCDLAQTCVGNDTCEDTCYGSAPTCDFSSMCEPNSCAIPPRQPAPRASRQQVFLAKVFANMF